MKKIVLFLAMASLFSCKQSEEKMISTKETSSENEKIAKELFVSINTTKAHVANILQKLEVDDRLQAALKALKHKIV